MKCLNKVLDLEYHNTQKACIIHVTSSLQLRPFIICHSNKQYAVGKTTYFVISYLFQIAKDITRNADSKQIWIDCGGSYITHN